MTFFDFFILFVQCYGCSDFIIFVDFNSVLTSSERWGIIGFGTTSKELINLVDVLHLQDLLLINLVDVFQKAFLTYIFDHLPIMFQLGNFNLGPYSFRFFNI